MSVRVNGASKPRFELPALDLNFGSITDGTIIPPPPESPKVPTPPRTPRPTKTPDVVALGPVENGVGHGVVKETQTDEFASPNGSIAGIKRIALEAPLSPAGSARQGSLRRLFNKNMPSTNPTDGSLTLLENGSRPPSRGTSSLTGGRKARRNSWFKLFRGGETKRSSIFFDDIPSPKNPVVVGPPPPMIPELRDLEKDEGSLGNDLFKNIKG